ncbi:MAG: hypothetical protein ACMUHY_05195, partial [Thermoplasmatota archaeon]
MSDGRTNIVLPLVLVGAILLSTVGFMGLLLTVVKNIDNEENDLENVVPHSREYRYAEKIANKHFEASIQQGEIAMKNAPEQRPMPSSKGFQESLESETNVGMDEVRTRSEDELLSQNGYVSVEDAPRAPAVEMEETFGLMDGKGELLVSASECLREGKAPDLLSVVEIEDELDMPVGEEGVRIKTEHISDLDTELELVSDEMGGYLGEYSPGTKEAGLSEEDIDGFSWDLSNRTTRDSDRDGNPEYINYLRVFSGKRNDTLLNGTLTWIVGYNFTYEDINSDGIPNMEERTFVKYANYTVNGKKVAEGISLTRTLHNDTDNNGAVDRIEIRHLSYGYRFTLLKGVKSYATAGELVIIDGDNDGTFEDREGTAVFYYKYETGSPLVTVRESVVMVRGKEKAAFSELSRLAFTRINSTAGKTLLEKGYGWTLKVQENSRNLVIVAANNNTLTGRLQYVILNAT